jgi:hypothetical protein
MSHERLRDIFDGRFGPTTWGIGFVEAPLRKVVDASVAGWSPHMGNLEVAWKDSRDLETILQSLPPLSGRSRWAFIETTSPWTAYFDNSSFTPEANTACMAAVQWLKTRAVGAVDLPQASKDGPGYTYGAVQFMLFTSKWGEFGHNLRSVIAMNDGGRWRFDALGEVQPFEETEAYKAKRIRDRFTPEMLVRYCKALGIDLANPDFYRGRAAIVTRQDWIDKGCPGLTLNEARAKLGLPPSPGG